MLILPGILQLRPSAGDTSALGVGVDGTRAGDQATREELVEGSKAVGLRHVDFAEVDVVRSFTNIRR